MDALSSQFLSELFKANTEKAIEAAIKLMIGRPGVDFDEWAEEEKKRITEFSCQETWHSPHIVVICQTCAIGKNSGICVPCYLRGNHEGHSVSLDISYLGVCDCGNNCCWNPKGFCKKHSAQVPADPQIIDLGEARSEFIGSIVLCAISALLPLAPHESRSGDIDLICDFLDSLISIGDAYRRIVSLVFVDDFDLNDLLFNWPRFTNEAADLIYHKLIVELINDSVFINRFSTYFCDSFIYLISVKATSTTLFDEDDMANDFDSDNRSPVSILLDASFYIWSYISSHPSLFDFNNIPDLLTRTLNVFNSLFAYNQQHPIMAQAITRNIFEYLGILVNTSYFHEILSDIDCQEKLCSYLRSISLIEASPIVEKNTKLKPASLKYSCLAHHLIYIALKPLVKVNASSSSFFSVLSMFVVLNVIRDIVDHSPNCPPTTVWQRSVFSSGVCLGCFLPLHFIAFEHFIMHTTNPHKDWQQIAENQNMDSEMLLFGTSVLPIRTCAIASYISFGLSPAPSVVNYSFNHEATIRGRYAAAFCSATLLKQPDEFVSMVMHTFGLLDDNEHQITHPTFTTRLFVFYHFLTILLFDNSIFARTELEILRSQAIAFLQQGPTTISKLLENLEEFDDNVECSYKLKIILDEVAYKLRKTDPKKSRSKSSKSQDDDDAKLFFGSKPHSMKPKSYSKRGKSLPTQHSIFTPSNSSCDSSSSSSSASIFSLESSSTSTLFTLKPKFKTVVPFNIWTKPLISYDILLRQIRSDNPSIINLNLHRAEPFPEGFNTFRLLSSRSFFASCYITLLEVESKIDFGTISLMFNLLLYAHKLHPETSTPKQSLSLIKVQTYNQLCMVIPSSIHIFMKTPFQYKQRPAASFIDLARNLGTLGTSFLAALSKNGNHANTNNKKKMAEITRFQELSEINRQINDFMPKMVKNDVHQSCIICHKPIKVTELIPCLVHPFIMKPAGRGTLRVALNGSTFHSKCLLEAKESNLYFNFILNDPNSVIKIFDNNLTRLIQTIADEIEILEIRLSRNPFVFKDHAPSIKLFHLFETAKLVAKKERANKQSPRSKSSPSNENNLKRFRAETDFLSMFISDLAFAKNAKDSFFDIFHQIYPHEFNRRQEVHTTAFWPQYESKEDFEHLNPDLFSTEENQLFDFVQPPDTQMNSNPSSNSTETSETAQLNSTQPKLEKTSDQPPKTAQMNSKQLPQEIDSEQLYLELSKNVDLNDTDSVKRLEELVRHAAAINDVDPGLQKQCELKEKRIRQQYNSDFSMLRRCLLVAYYIGRVISVDDCEKTINSPTKIVDFFFRKRSTKSLAPQLNVPKDENGEIDYSQFFYYPFCYLPRNFLEFSVFPFNFPILSTDISKSYLDLQTGEYLEAEDLECHIHEIRYTMLLVLTGKMAGSVKVVLFGDPIVSKVVDSPYVTMFGDEQCGLKDGEMLWLNQDRLWRLCDDFLNGSLLA